jgi:uncharacterized protein (DUF433 family)
MVYQVSLSPSARRDLDCSIIFNGRPESRAPLWTISHQQATLSAQMPTETMAHIRLDERGVAWIDQTNVKVIEVVLDQIAHRSSPEEIHFQYPHLSLAQIYAALAYYHDHQIELDAQIDKGAQEYERLKTKAGESPLQKRLKQLGKLR